MEVLIANATRSPPGAAVTDPDRGNVWPVLAVAVALVLLLTLMSVVRG
jgi:hypothetical protein